MTKQEIIEGNKLIAKFMGLKSITPTYNSSWNFLMPVIDKIELIYDEHHGYFGVHISGNSCSIQGTKLHMALNNPNYGWVYSSDTNAIFETKIESAFYNVVQFIKWYNNERT